MTPNISSRRLPEKKMPDCRELRAVANHHMGQSADRISNAYQWQRELYNDVAASFVSSFIVGKEHPNPQLQPAVNA